MLPKYNPIVAQFTPAVQQLLRQELGLKPSPCLYTSLHAAGFGQADVVLVLLRLDLPQTRSAAEALVGHPIRRPPPHNYPKFPPSVPPSTKTSPDDRRVKSVERNPRLPTTPSFFRYQFFRPGVTVRSLLARGVTRKDIREALQHGWVTFA